MKFFKKYKIYSYVMKQKPVDINLSDRTFSDIARISYKTETINIHASHMVGTNLYSARTTDNLGNTVNFYGRMARKLYEHGAKQK